MIPTFSIITPTLGAATLRNSLESIKRQELIPGDEAIVVGDGLQAEAAQLVAEFGPRFRYLEGPVTHLEGNAQRDLGIQTARGSHLIMLDEDDVLCPGALAAVRAAIQEAPNVPHGFCIYGAEGQVVGQDCSLAFTRISGQNFVPPNNPERLATWHQPRDTCGDFRFIHNTLALYGDSGVMRWHPEIIYQQMRPHLRGGVWWSSDHLGEV